jgi:glutamyl-tRNA synthetase
MIRTRFAPSPTGYLHIGGARTALFSWAYARSHGGRFILRIEDTDLERSTEASVQAILDAMRWLGLDWDEGPFFQMKRISRYKEVAETLISQGKAYRCWATREELDAMRERQRAHGEKPRYDGRWRPERAKATGLVPPADRPPVVRFRNPDDGEVSFNDLIKGAITVGNAELDDLVLLRSDGVPTYNFGVVVDDLDMKITHVIRGDDHVNNTPRQVNIFRALGAELPKFAHVPMILGHDGERLSKRHGAVSVMQYHEDGYLPEALVNYLARLGWSHGDDEIFSRDRFVEWFDLAHVSQSAARFDPEKLRWLNHQYLRRRADADLKAEVAPRVEKKGGKLDDGPDLERIVSLFKDRAETLEAVSTAAMIFYKPAPVDMARQNLTGDVRQALRDALSRFRAIEDWSDKSVMDAVHAVMGQHGLKLPQIAMPLRLIIFGTAQTPNLGSVLALAGKKRVLERLQEHLGA